MSEFLLAAAGAVLIATAVAVAVGYLVFSGQVAERSSDLLNRLTDAPAELTLIALVLTTIIVIGTKALTGSGTPLRGAPSAPISVLSQRTYLWTSGMRASPRDLTRPCQDGWTPARSGSALA